MWDVIVSVPDHCLSFYFAYTKGKDHKAPKSGLVNKNLLTPAVIIFLACVTFLLSELVYSFWIRPQIL